MFPKRGAPTVSPLYGLTCFFPRCAHVDPCTFAQYLEATGITLEAVGQYTEKSVCHRSAHCPHVFCTEPVFACWLLVEKTKIG